jgi:predicted nucleic acid-binding protein
VARRPPLHVVPSNSAARLLTVLRASECSHLLETLPGPLLAPATIVAEVCYTIGRSRFGAAAEVAFLRSFASRDLVVADLVEDDFERMAQLVQQHDDLPLGGSDASITAIAERRSVSRGAGHRGMTILRYTDHVIRSRHRHPHAR